MAHKWDPPLFSLDEHEKMFDPLLSQIHQDKPKTKKLICDSRKPVTVDNPPEGEGWELQDIVLMVDGQQRTSKAWFKNGAITDFLKQNEDPEVRKQTVFVPNQSLLFEPVPASQSTPEPFSQFEVDLTKQPTTSLMGNPFENYELEQPFVDVALFDPPEDPFQNDVSELYNYQQTETCYEYIYPCEKCGAEFKSEAGRNEHKDTHLKNRHTCHICGEDCANNVLLERHVLDHSKPTIFKCRYPRCTKIFNSKIALVAHYRAHSREQKFSCDFCGRHFTNSGHVKSHMRKMHPETDWLYPDSEVKQLFNNYNNHSHRHQFL